MHFVWRKHVSGTLIEKQNIRPSQYKDIEEHKKSNVQTKDK